MPVEMTRDIGRRIASNASILLCADMLGKLTQAVFVVYVARVLGVQRYGVYALTFTVFFFLEFLAQFGMRPMAVREIARNRNKAERLVSGILILLFGGAFSTYALLLLGLSFLKYGPEVRTLIYLLALTLFPRAISHTFTVMSYGFERMTLPSIVSVVSGLTSSSLGVLVISLGGELKGLVEVLVAVGMGEGLIAGWFILRDCPGTKLRVDWPLWRELIKQSLPFGILGFLMLVHSKVDIFMLSIIRGPLDGLLAIGYYTPAHSILSALMLLPGSLRLAMVPSLASHENSITAIRSTLEGTTKFLFAFVGFPMIIATTFFANDIVTLLFGESYLPTAGALQVMGWAYAMVAATMPAFAVISVSRHVGRYVPWALGGVLVNVLLNLLLIPAYSFIGAAIATLITQTLGGLFRLYLVKQMVGMPISDAHILLDLLGPMATTFGVAWFLHWACTPSSLVLAPLVIATYVGALVVFRVFRKEEISFLMPMWGSRLVRAVSGGRL
jgi:O-antigen/teichoic acid export membrane protein